MVVMSIDVRPGRSLPAVAGARETTRRFLGGLAQPLAGRAADSVVLVVSELVTNALRHGGGAFSLDLQAHPDTIEVAVHDHSSEAPRLRVVGLPGATTGFGWPMVNRLAHATAVTRLAHGGKTVSALLPR
ncbi:ATP-binding protein [Streptomyces sp. NPDC048508]|uniref:ATP-binding protein n=1 Tax=Streptomyces sp. NPDC048508 TaxID=3365561 RepID=UPI00371A02C3